MSERRVVVTGIGALTAAAIGYAAFLFAVAALAERRARRGQRLLHVYNRHTKSTTAFNPLRSKRPLRLGAPVRRMATLVICRGE